MNIPLKTPVMVTGLPKLGKTIMMTTSINYSSLLASVIQNFTETPAHIQMIPIAKICTQILGVNAPMIVMSLTKEPVIPAADKLVDGTHKTRNVKTIVSLSHNMLVRTPVNGTASKKCVNELSVMLLYFTVKRRKNVFAIAGPMIGPTSATPCAQTGTAVIIAKYLRKVSALRRYAKRRNAARLLHFCAQRVKQKMDADQKTVGPVQHVPSIAIPEPAGVVEICLSVTPH